VKHPKCQNQDASDMNFWVPPPPSRFGLGQSVAHEYSTSNSFMRTEQTAEERKQKANSLEDKNGRAANLRCHRNLDPHPCPWLHSLTPASTSHSALLHVTLFCSKPHQLPPARESTVARTVEYQYIVLRVRISPSECGSEVGSPIAQAPR